MNQDLKYIFIINPAAGKQTVQSEIISQIRAALPTERYELHFTSCEGDATRIAADCIEKNKNIAIFACGGDGTFFEVINGAAGKVPIGVIPCGSGNDFIKNIISPQNLLDVKAQLEGQTVPLDLIRCNGQYVSNICNIGFDAEIAEKMNHFRRLPFVSGKAAYILATAFCFFRYLVYPMNVQIDDSQPINTEFLFVAIANGQTYGGSFHGAPLASVKDGLIDVCLCKKLKRTTMMKYVLSFKDGTYLQRKGIDRWVDYRKCKKVRITMPKSTVIGYDGNVTYATEIEAEIVPAAMQLIIPQGAKLR